MCYFMYYSCIIFAAYQSSESNKSAPWNVLHNRGNRLIVYFKLPISSKFLFCHLILYFMQWTSAKKFFDLDQKRLFYEFLKTWESYYLAVDPSRWWQLRLAQSCDVDSGTCDFRLDLSRLFYLCKFNFVVHPFQHFVWTKKFNLQR